MSDPAERRIGTVIAGKWRIDGLLGSGSMAAVYAATHRNGVRAALKILHPALCTDEGVCERFLGEGYLTNSVKHAGIVRVLDDGMTEDGCVFLVMDLLEGKTLEALRQERGGRIPLEEMLDLADKLMDVLHAVHQAGIIHRDLKPQNVFVCNDGTVKLLDFGVARVLDGAQSKLSVFGMVLGTPSFMSPEQALGSRDKVDHCADIWSLGATLFTGLTGQTVHLGPHVQARLLAAATVKARSIAMVLPELPAAIAAAIDTALRFEKEERWQSVDAFRRALRDARGLTTPIEPVPTEESTRTKPTAVTTLMGIGPKTPNPKPQLALEPDPELADTEIADAEESYPGASSSTVEVEASGYLMAQVGRRRTAASTWMVGLVLAVVAIGGVAFFAINRGAVGPVPASPPQLSSATLPGPSVETASSAKEVPVSQPVSTPASSSSAASAASAMTATLASATASTPVASKPAPPTPRPRATRTPSPPPTTIRIAPPPSEPLEPKARTDQPAERPAPTLAPDPFSTPE